MVSTLMIFYEISFVHTTVKERGLTVVAPVLVANSVSARPTLPALESFDPIHRDECAIQPPFPSISKHDNQLNEFILLKSGTD